MSTRSSSTPFKAYTLPQPGEKRPRKKVAKQLVTAMTVENLNANNTDLDVYFEIQRREMEAADRIKRSWKRSRVLIPWRRAAYTLLRIVKIQARVRGMIARRYVALWHALRTRFVVDTQARVRRVLSNKHLRPVLRREEQSARLIQRVTRGWLGRRRYTRILGDLCATRIQALWRGVIDRTRADKAFLNLAIIPIQKSVRAMIARRKSRELRKSLYEAATVIQRQFRLFLATRMISDRLFEREMRYRKATIDRLIAEEAMCAEKIERLMERVVKFNVKERAEQAMREVTKSEADIHDKERAYGEIYRQLEILTPRAVREGFDVDLAKKKKTLREELTAMKQKHIFELCVEQQQQEEVFENQVKELEEWATHCKRVAQWKQDEYDERRHITYEREINERRRERRMAIAHERRHWQVRFYTSDGKPDKKRRPGRPWDPSVLAGPEKMTYSGADVDLFAFSQPIASLHPAGGAAKDPSASIDNTMKQVALQAHLEQVKVFEELLDPIARILQQNMGFLPRKDGSLQGLAQSGWGPEGAKAEEAMRALNMDEITPNNRESLIGGFSAHNVMYKHDNEFITRRGRAKSRGSAKRIAQGGNHMQAIAEEEEEEEEEEEAEDREGEEDNTMVSGSLARAQPIWTGESETFRSQPQPAQPHSDSFTRSQTRPAAPERDAENDAFSMAQTVDSFSTASLDPGSTFPQHAHYLRNNNSNNNSHQSLLSRTHRHQASFSSQRSRLSQSREKDKLLNRNNIADVVIHEESESPRRLSLSPKARSPRASSLALINAQRSVEHGGIPRTLRKPYSSLSSMFVDDEVEQMSAITEGDEQASEGGAATVTAEEIFQSLRRCWKRPPKKYLPAADAFSSLYVEERESEQAEFAKERALVDDDTRSRRSRLSMSDGSVMSRSTLNFFRDDPDYLLKKKKEEEMEKKHSRRKQLEDDIAKKREAERKKREEEEDDVFFREDLVTEQEKKQRAAKVVRQEMHETRRAKKKELVKTSVIPWSLLDEIAGNKQRFEAEKAYLDYHHKV